VQNVYEARSRDARSAQAVARVALARLDGDVRAYRAQRRAARELLVWLAQSSLGGADAPFSVGTSAAGQPSLLAGGTPVRDVSVSLSHSQDWIAAGLARGGRLGIDVERENPRRRVAAMAEWMGWPECHEPDAFYSAWTYHEARIKCRGGESPRGDEGVPPLAHGAPTSRHHAHWVRPVPDVHACMLVETDRPQRLEWSATGLERPSTWS
jgi:phosphopantetheinyl transferase